MHRLIGKQRASARRVETGYLVAERIEYRIGMLANFRETLRVCHDVLAVLRQSPLMVHGVRGVVMRQARALMPKVMGNCVDQYILDHGRVPAALSLIYRLNLVHKHKGIAKPSIGYDVVGNVGAGRSRGPGTHVSPVLSEVLNVEHDPWIVLRVMVHLSIVVIE